MPNWTKGKSGNPNGRPRTGKALTDLIERALSETQVDPDTDKRITKKRIMARLLTEVVTTGQVTFVDPDGSTRVLEFTGNEWSTFVLKLVQQVDGQKIDLNANANVTFIFDIPSGEDETETEDPAN